MLEIPDWLGSTLASDAAGGEGVMESWLRPLRADRRVAGYATVVTVAEGDNLFIRKAAARGAGQGTVLVAVGSPTSRLAVMGDILAQALVNAGFRAIVTDGLIRDVAEVRRLPLEVWCRGVTPISATKQGPGSLDGPAACGGVSVSTGDLVIADDDGVVVWPAARLAELLPAAELKWRSDSSRAERVAAGGPID